MPVTWDSEPSKGNISWDDEQTGSSPLQSIWEGAKGTGAAALDIGAGLFKYPAQVGLAAAGTAFSGLRPDIAREEAQSTVENMAPSIGPALGVDKNIGYTAPMYPFEKWNQGVDWLGNKISDNPALQGVAKQVMDIGTLALPGRAKDLKKLAESLKIKERPKAGNELGPEPTGPMPSDLTAPEVGISEPTMTPQSWKRVQTELGMETKPFQEPNIVWDKNEPKLGDLRTPEEKVAEGLQKKEDLSGIQQKELFPYESPYLPKDARLVTDENGIQFSPDRTAELGQEVAKSGLNPDLIEGQAPWIAPEGTGRQTTEQRPLPYQPLETSKFQLEKQSSEGPTQAPLPKFISDNLRIPLSEQNPFVFADQTPQAPGIDFVPPKKVSPMIQKSSSEGVKRSRLIAKKQQGSILPDTSLSDLAEKLRSGWDAMMKSGDLAKDRPAESGDLQPTIDAIKRGYEAMTTAKEPQVFSSGREKLLNVGPGGKQSGAVDPQVFLEGLRKGSKSVEEFTKKLVDELGEGFRPLAASLYNKEPTKETKEITPKQNQLPKAFKEHLLADDRPIEQFVSEESKNFENWKDLNPWTDATESFPLSIVAARAKKSPTVNWMWNKLTRLDNESFIKKEVVKYGSEFGVDTRGFKKHIKSDDGAMTILDSLPKDRKTFAMNTFFEKFEGKDVPVNLDVLKNEGYSEREANGILAARQGMDNFVKDYNDYAKSVGEPPITPRPNYLPHSWKGDYRIFVRNADGNLIKAVGAETRGQAKAIEAGLKEQMPGYTIERPFLSKSKYDTSELRAYKDAIEFLEKDDPAKKILDKVINDILVHRGFRKSTLFREGVEGFDTDTSIVGDYLDKGYNFLYNQKKKAAFSDMVTQLKEAGMDLQKDKPNTYKYLTDVLMNSTGYLKDELPLYNAVLDSVGLALGQGPKGTQRFIRGLNGWASANLLTTPVFLGVQATQPGFNIPKALQLGKGPLETTNAVGEAYRASIVPEQYHLDAMDWAVRNGYVQSRVASMLDLQADNPKSWLGKAPVWWANKIIGKADTQLARIPSFFFYDSLLKNDIPSREARWHQAGMLANEIMVNYSPTNRPLFLGRLGETIGPAVRPFTQFPLSYFGQLLTYIGDAKSPKALAPLGAFLAVQAVLGGINGFIGVNDANTIINKLNDIFKTNITNMEEWLSRSNISNTFIYGPISTMTGMNISSTTSAPSLMNPPMAPGISLGAKAVINVAKLGINALKGEMTEADKMQVSQSVLPRVAQGAIEDYFTKPGKGTPNPYNSMEPDLPPRKKGSFGGILNPDNPLVISDTAARYLGSRSPQEAREKMQVSANRKETQIFSERRKDLIGVIVDRISEGKNFDDVTTKYLDYQGTTDSLVKDLISNIKDRNMTYAQRYLGNVQGLTGAQRAQRLQSFHLLIENAPIDQQMELMKELNK